MLFFLEYCKLILSSMSIYHSMLRENKKLMILEEIKDDAKL